MEKYKTLLSFCKTDRQTEVIAKLASGKTQIEVARELCINDRAIRKHVKRVKDYRNKRELENSVGMIKEIPDGYKLKGYSDMRTNDEGKPVWFKVDQDHARQIEIMQQTIESLQKDIIKADPVPFDKEHFCTDRIPWINVGDGHLGMIASESITGEHFDQNIAKQELCVAIATLIHELPDTERCVLQDMGDLSHFESQHRMSLNSGHSFDGCDYSDMVDITIEVMHFMIDQCLRKFKYVDVIINRGNHSDSNDVTMASNLRKYFENEPRIHILDNRNRFIGYRMGNTFVLCTHGDKVKAEKIASVIHTDFKQDAGECKYIYADTAHIHTGKVMSETHGIVAESFNQIAAADAYAHDGGWRSRKCLTAVIRSKTYGEQGRSMVSREQVQDIIAKGQGVASKAFARRGVYTV